MTSQAPASSSPCLFPVASPAYDLGLDEPSTASPPATPAPPSTTPIGTRTVRYVAPGGGGHAAAPAARRLARDLERLREIAATLSLPAVVARIDEDLRRLQENRFTLAVVGEFIRGKTTLVNALLGRDLLPTDILPSSAVLNRVIYGPELSATVTFEDGREKTIAIDRLGCDLAAEAATGVPRPVKVTVRCPAACCKNDVEILDTPGLNEDERMTALTLGVLPHADAAILVVSAYSPFSDYERAFLQDHLLAGDLNRVLFVVTGIDRLNRPEDADRIVSHIGKRIQKLVLDQAKEEFGKDSDEYAACREKIGTPRVFGVDAYHALVARQSGDDALLAETRFPVFESALQAFLVQERPAAFLQARIGRLLWAADEILAALPAPLPGEAASAPQAGQIRPWSRSLFRGVADSAQSGDYKAATQGLVNAALQTAQVVQARVQTEVTAALADPQALLSRVTADWRERVWGAATGAAASAGQPQPLSPRAEVQQIVARAERVGASLDALSSAAAPCSETLDGLDIVLDEDVFTPAEWQALQFAPHWVFQAVARRDNRLPDPKERGALCGDLEDPAAYPALAREVFYSVACDTKLEARFAVETRSWEAGLTEAARLVDDRLAPADASAFKMSLLLLGRVVAEAPSEKWFEAAFNLQEKERLHRIGALLGLPMQFPSPARRALAVAEWQLLRQAVLVILWLAGDPAAAGSGGAPAARVSVVDRGARVLRRTDTSCLPALARELLDSVKAELAAGAASALVLAFLSDTRAPEAVLDEASRLLVQKVTPNEATALQMSLLFLQRVAAETDPSGRRSMTLMTDEEKRALANLGGLLALPMEATAVLLPRPAAPPAATMPAPPAPAPSTEPAAVPVTTTAAYDLGLD